MKSQIMVISIIFSLSLIAASAWAGTEGTSNTFYGAQAGQNTADDNDKDTFIGRSAGNANTTGDKNTFVGYLAGSNNTEAGANTFIGYFAGRYNTAGNYNTFVGYNAGSDNTTGSKNTSFGYTTSSGTEGHDNTSVGSSAGGGTTGDANTFIGKSAGQSITTGNNNTFLGHYAGAGNDTGAYNTFLGRTAGSSNTTGNYNTFAGGYGAGHQNTTGASNTFFGNQSGYTNATGNNNTFLGRQSGHLTTGSANVFLGYRAGFNETGSNKLYIANSDTASPLIYGDFSSPSLTINGNFDVINPSGFNRFSDNLTDATQKVARITLNHYTNSEEPIYLFGGTSLTSATYAHFGGGSTLGNAVTQMDFWTAANTTTLTGTSRLTIKSNGNVGIGTRTPSYALHMAGGAYSDGASWIDASSREYKDDIEALPTQEALDTLRELNPVKFAYKTDRTEKHVGFIAEDVPDLIATKDRKGLSSMDIVAVLTKVVQEQQGVIAERQQIFEKRQKAINELSAELNELKRELQL